MIALSQAIKTRYDAKALNTSVGAFYQGRAATQATMPYVIYQEISANVFTRTRRNEYSNVVVQWDVYCSDGNPATASDALDSIFSAMEYGERGAANALDPSGLTILNSQVVSQSRAEEEGLNQVYRATGQQQFTICRALDRTPA